MSLPPMPRPIPLDDRKPICEQDVGADEILCYVGVPDVNTAAIMDQTVWGRPRRLGGLSVLHSNSVLYGALVWARRALNSPKPRGTGSTRRSTTRSAASRSISSWRRRCRGQGCSLAGSLGAGRPPWPRGSHPSFLVTVWDPMEATHRRPPQAEREASPQEGGGRAKAGGRGGAAAPGGGRGQEGGG
jgi:hypothetical protein